MHHPALCHGRAACSPFPCVSKKSGKICATLTSRFGFLVQCWSIGRPWLVRPMAWVEQAIGDSPLSLPVTVPPPPHARAVPEHRRPTQRRGPGPNPHAGRPLGRHPYPKSSKMPRTHTCYTQTDSYTQSVTERNCHSRQLYTYSYTQSVFFFHFIFISPTFSCSNTVSHPSHNLKLDSKFPFFRF